MPLLNIAELIDDLDFNQNYSFIRRSGSWNNGRFETKEEEIKSYGVIEPQDTSELDLLPDGSMIRGRIKLYTHDRLYLTVLDTPSSTGGYISDEVIWKNNKYLVILDNDYSDFGYYEYTCEIKDASGGTDSQLDR